ncbi:MAG: DUF6398 domain-containing protein [Oscillospiraceae bacterium]|jgi:hypothetical protein|nr:DUF6398 domain-containing protein [Oscillospiraceae bacterium]
MNLSKQDIILFFKLWYKLLCYVNLKLKIIKNFSEPIYPNGINQEKLNTIRNKLWENPTLISDYLKDNDSAELAENERKILASWKKHHINSRFLIMKHLKKYSVLMSYDENTPTRIYGVVGISESFYEMMPFEVLPIMIKIILLPFKEQIIYDGLIGTYNVSFGSGYRRNFNDMYKEIKAKYGIIESLPVLVFSNMRKNNIGNKNSTIPKNLEKKHKEISDILVKFCKEKLNDEFCEIMLYALSKLCCKKISPISFGKANSWACGIACAIGSINYIFDKNQSYYIPWEKFMNWFGISASTAKQKSAKVDEELKTYKLTAEFMTNRVLNKSDDF